MSQSERKQNRRPAGCPEGGRVGYPQDRTQRTEASPGVAEIRLHSLRGLLALALLLLWGPASAPAAADAPETVPPGRLAVAGATLIERGEQGERGEQSATQSENRGDHPATSAASTPTIFAPVHRSAAGRTVRAISPYPSEVDGSDCVGCRWLCDGFISLPGTRRGIAGPLAPALGPNRPRLLLPMRSLCGE